MHKYVHICKYIHIQTHLQTHVYIASYEFPKGLTMLDLLRQRMLGVRGGGQLPQSCTISMKNKTAHPKTKISFTEVTVLDLFLTLH